MNTLSPLLLKILLISLPLSLIGLGGNRLLRHSPLPRQRNFINLIMATLLLLPLLVWIGPSLVRVPIPPADTDAPLLISFSQNLVSGIGPRTSALSPESLLGWTWLLGSLVGFLQLGWGIGKIQVHIRSGRPLSDREIASLHDHGLDLPLRRIRLSPGLKGPAAAGFIRPWVLIPKNLFQHMDPSEFRAVVLHEWAHIRNRDALFSLMGESVTLLYWWNPFLWRMQHQRQRLPERIGDETAAQGAGKLDYAKALVSLVEKSRQNQELRGAMAFFGPLSLRERIERILNKEDRMNGKKMRMGVFVIGSLAMAVMLVASGTEFIARASEGGEAESGAAVAQDSTQDAQGAEKVKRLPIGRLPSLKKLDLPAYPPEALQNRVTSEIVLVITVDPQGKVEKAEVVSGHPLFNEAATTAAKQWLFSPYLENGRAKRVQFTIVVHFGLTASNQPDIRLGQAPGKALAGAFSETAMTAVNRPKKVKDVTPVYPPEALANRVQGVVTLEVTTNIQGRVRALRVISGHPLLNSAAVDAVKQWEFEPTRAHGQPQAATFPVTVAFTLPQNPSQPSEAAKK